MDFCTFMWFGPINNWSILSLWLGWLLVSTGPMLQVGSSKRWKCEGPYKDNVNFSENPSHTETAKNAEVLGLVLDVWLKEEGANSQGPVGNRQGLSARAAQHGQSQGPHTQFVRRQNTEQWMFLTCQDSVNKLVSMTQGHRKFCTKSLVVQKVTFSGHAAVIKLNYEREDWWIPCLHLVILSQTARWKIFG